MGNAADRGVRRAVVAFLARQLDEPSLRAQGWSPAGDPVRWYASWSGGRRHQPYRTSGPSGPFTRYRGDAPEALYRLDADGGWTLDPGSGEWRPCDAPVRLSELQRLSPSEVDELYELDDWGGWYFDYGAGCWTRAEAPLASYYLAELVLHEIDRNEAVRVAAALGAPSAVEA